MYYLFFPLVHQLIDNVIFKLFAVKRTLQFHRNLGAGCTEIPCFFKHLE